MITQRQLHDVIGATAYDRDGHEIGQVRQVYYDDGTNEPKWITVATGLFGLRESFVPLQGVELGGHRVVVDYATATVKAAPHVKDDHLGPDEEARLYRHYGLDPAAGRGAGNAAAGLDTQPAKHPSDTEDDGPQRSDESTAADRPGPTPPRR